MYKNGRSQGEVRYIRLFVRSAECIGTRWRRWLTYFETYADSRGLIINDGNDANKQRRRALLLFSAGQAVQDIFMTLPDTGTAKEYQKAVDVLNIHFIPKVNTSVFYNM